MNRLLALVILGTLLPLAGCAQPSALTVTGRVAIDPITVQVPVLAQPTVNLDAGFVTQGSLGRPGANRSSVAASLGLGSVVRVTEVEVKEGDQVTAGQVLLRLDDSQLVADVHAARADAEVSRRQIAMLDSTIADTYDKDADLDEARRKVLDGIAQATRARTQLTAKLAQAKTALRQLPGQLSQVQTKLAQVTAGLDEAKAALAALPPEAPPETRAQLQQTVAMLTAAKAQLTKARSQLTTAIGQLRTGIPKLTKALATIATGLAKARRALTTIDSAKGKLADARTQLRGLKRLAAVAADAGKTAVSVARVLREQAVVTAPDDGIVTDIADPGAVLAPGATAATIRPATDRVVAWLSPAQLAQVCVGDRVAVQPDWEAPAVSATLTRIGDTASYPPTATVTNEIHLTRAIPVEVAFDPAAGLPGGVPLDITITPCQPAGTNR